MRGSEMIPDCRDVEFAKYSLADLLDSKEDVVFLPERLLEAYRVTHTGGLADYVLLEDGRGADRKVVGYILRSYAFDVLGYLADHVEELIEGERLPDTVRERATAFVAAVWAIERGVPYEK